MVARAQVNWSRGGATAVWLFYQHSTVLTGGLQKETVFSSSGGACGFYYLSREPSAAILVACMQQGPPWSAHRVPDLTTTSEVQENQTNTTLSARPAAGPPTPSPAAYLLPAQRDSCQHVPLETRAGTTPPGAVSTRMRIYFSSAASLARPDSRLHGRPSIPRPFLFSWAVSP